MSSTKIRLLLWSGCLGAAVLSAAPPFMAMASDTSRTHSRLG